jgi:sulfite oxidase
MDVLALSQPAAKARFVQVSAGTYSISLALDESGESLLCDTLNGQPLTVEHGAPWRLIVPGGKCFTSVKWVQRLVLSREPGDNSGEQIARARLT